MILIKRYLFDYLLYLSISFLFFLTMLWFFDGIPVYIAVFLFFTISVFFVPYKVREDYKKNISIFNWMSEI